MSYREKLAAINKEAFCFAKDLLSNNGERNCIFDPENLDEDFMLRGVRLAQGGQIHTEVGELLKFMKRI